MDCPEVVDLVEPRIDEVLTQYRESSLLLGLLRSYLASVAQIEVEACRMFWYFDLDTAVGDQLTILGKILGFPRCHCVCVASPVIGYNCVGYSGPYEIVGYCAPGSTFVNCPPLGNSELCITDDEQYRAILKARRYQMLGLYDIESLQEAIRFVWGDGAQVAETRIGEVILAPGRALTAQEATLLPIVFRAFPIAPGMKGLLHVDSNGIAGYGAGWGGYCDGSGWLCVVDPQTYACT